MARLIIISNRLPITINKKENAFFYSPSAGGLATGLNSLDESWNKIWIGWPGEEVSKEKDQERVRKDLTKDNLVPVFLNQKEITEYYEGFSNKTIWPHFHYFTQYTEYDEERWEVYQEVNKKFAEVTIDVLEEDDLVWVHDYQLMLVPALIREAFPKISIGFFLHIPFPSYEIFRILPWRKEILEGVLGADQVGFHTFGYMRHFLSASYRITGYEHNFGKLAVGNRLVNVDVFPMGIDYEKFAFPVQDFYRDDGTFLIKQLAKHSKIVVSIDRLDYTKGIPQRIQVFSKFLKEHPEYQRKVTLVLIVVPSRANVDQYQELKNRVDTLVGEINGTFGTFDWMPILYFYRSLDFSELTTLYQVSDIAMITPLRDGMNLVAKEYIASKEVSKKGVLILSEMAGSASELTEALIVNPQDMDDMVHALKQALEMNEKEQWWRLETLQERIKRYDVKKWAINFIEEQKKLKQIVKQRNTKHLNVQKQQEVFDRYANANSSLLMLDYDGTLMGFQSDPKAVIPDDELKEMLLRLSERTGNLVVLNSGRDQPFMKKWLEPLGVDLAAEHGVWVKKGGVWNRGSGLATAWKKDVRPVLENLVERTPGSFIEEKEFSVAWHYRQIDKDLGEKRVREFRDVLLYLTANLDLQVLEGNKVVEIKNAGVNKGKAALNWVNDKDWDFILAIGDDHTDEDTFRVMPDDAYTVKVGHTSSAARYHLGSVEEVRGFLGELSSL